VCFDRPNPISIKSIVVVDFVRPKFELEKNICSVGASIEEPFSSTSH
jgi:hypothetical protein